MGRIKNKEGKYPEEVVPFDTERTMVDDKFLLMKQCIRDARELHIMVRHFNSYEDHVYLDDWSVYEKAVLELAAELFRERARNPISTEKLKQIILAGEGAKQTIKDIQFLEEELHKLFAEIEALKKQRDVLNKEIKEHKKEIAKLNAQEFLKSTVGKANFESLKRDGFLSITGTNGATYTIERTGKITKVEKGFFGIKERWSGRIKDTGGLPMDDAIATVYMHILRDSDKFDRNKACGQISVG